MLVSPGTTVHLMIGGLSSPYFTNGSSDLLIGLCARSLQEFYVEFSLY